MYARYDSFDVFISSGDTSCVFGYRFSAMRTIEQIFIEDLYFNTKFRLVPMMNLYFESVTVGCKLWGSSNRL